jgi:predicted porin
VNKSATLSYTQSNVELAAVMTMGVNTLGLSYAKAGDTDVNATGAKQVSLRYGYNFSKRTELFAAYTSLANDTAGAYGFFGTNAGSTQKAFGAGVIHSF